MTSLLPAPTLVRLILLGFTVALAPLVVGIVTAIVRVEGLAEGSQEAVLAVQADAVLTRALALRMREMERSARQFAVLQDEAYKVRFDEHAAQAANMLDALAKSTSLKDMREDLENTAATLTETRMRVELSMQAGFEEAGHNMDALFDALRPGVQKIVQEQERRAEALARAIPERATNLQRLLIGQAFLVVPLSVGLAVLGVILIARPVRQLGNAIRAIGQSNLGAPVTVTGAHDLQELAERLDWLRLRLAELEAQKAQFLRNASHELKTPLSNIREAVELLVDSDSDAEEQAAILQILRNNSLRLQQMIEALLKYGAEGDLDERTNFSEIDLARLVRERVEVHTTARTARNVKLKVKLADCTVLGQPKRLEVIIDNLLSNAIKYTPPKGTVRVTLRARGEQVHLDVKDSGPGVREQDRARIFDWFYTGPKPADGIVAGSGMGLAISHEYAAQQGGELTLLNKQSQGAHFRLTLRSTEPQTPETAQT